MEWNGMDVCISKQNLQLLCLLAIVSNSALRIGIVDSTCSNTAPQIPSRPRITRHPPSATHQLLPVYQTEAIPAPYFAPLSGLALEQGGLTVEKMSTPLPRKVDSSPLSRITPGFD